LRDVSQLSEPLLDFGNTDGSGRRLCKLFFMSDIVGFIISTLIYGFIIGIIGGVSRFHRGESTLAQRV
jgi:hypothetical protein